MRHWTRLAALPLALAAALYFAGCNGGGTTAEKKNGEEAHDHDHPAHGPHGGALVELGTDEKYHSEWATDESGKVTVWILDGTGEKEVAIAAEKVTITAKDPQGERSFDLAAVNRATGDKTAASQFEVEGADGKELLGVLETLGGDITATLIVDVGESLPRHGKIEKHEHKH